MWLPLDPVGIDAPSLEAVKGSECYDAPIAASNAPKYDTQRRMASRTLSTSLDYLSSAVVPRCAAIFSLHLASNATNAQSKERANWWRIPL
jgi:hypothetical protein